MSGRSTRVPRDEFDDLREEARESEEARRQRDRRGGSSTAQVKKVGGKFFACAPVSVNPAVALPTTHLTTPSKVAAMRIA